MKNWPEVLKLKISTVPSAPSTFLRGHLAWRGAGHLSMGPQILARRAVKRGRRSDPDVLPLQEGGSRHGAAAVDLRVRRGGEVPHVLLRLTQHEGHLDPGLTPHRWRGVHVRRGEEVSHLPRFLCKRARGDSHFRGHVSPIFCNISAFFFYLTRANIVLDSLTFDFLWPFWLRLPSQS